MQTNFEALKREQYSTLLTRHIRFGLYAGRTREIGADESDEDARAASSDWND